MVVPLVAWLACLACLPPPLCLRPARGEREETSGQLCAKNKGFVITARCGLIMAAWKMTGGRRGEGYLLHDAIH